MSDVPRIIRGVPRGAISRPAPPGLPVVARIRWHDARDTDLPAIATAWTRDAVEIAWEAPTLGLRSDWIPAEDVRRTTAPTKLTTPRPPDTRGQARRTGDVGPLPRSQ